MEKRDYIINAYNTLRMKGVCHTQKDFANLLGINQASISKAFNGDEKYLTSNLLEKVRALLEDGESAVPVESVQMFPALDNIMQGIRNESLPVIPTEAMAGTLGDFADSVSSYECERIISPIKGADYAMKVTGDSMSPEFPSGCQILIKKINEKAFIEWGKVYVLDTENGAVIKQIRKTEKENVVECVSINPAFQPFTIETSFIKGWYRVLMVLALK